MKTQFIPHKEENTFPGSSDNSKSDAADDDDQTQPFRAVSAPQKAKTYQETEAEVYQEPAYSEHVSGNLVVYPSEAPNFRPVYQPYQPPNQQGQGNPYAPQQPLQNNGTQYPVAYPYAPYPPYPGTQQYGGYPGYPPHGQNNYAGVQTQYAPYYNHPAYGYPPYGYAWPPAKPKRDGYLLGISITSFTGSILVLLSGIVSALFLLLITLLPTANLAAGQKFGSVIEFFAFTVAGLLGGGFTFYHSLRSLFLKKRSAEFKLPWFWIFFALYLIVVLIAAVMHAHGQAITNEPLTIFMISLAGILPSLTIVALGVRRVHFPRSAHWPTTWRRFAVALVSGATLAIVLALIFELLLTVVLQKSLGVSVSLDNPDQQIPQDPKSILFLFLLVSVVAPLVEEGVKPLAVVIMIGRIRSAGEAFILGLACGTGFNLIETTGYMGMGYTNWLSTAIERTSSGLLHGFGAAMVSLGWYYLTHPKESKHRILLPICCWGYAVLQHATWNGSFGLQLLPAPIGPYLDNGVVSLGPLSFPSILLVYGILTILMLTFFLYMTKKVRPKNPPVQLETDKAANEHSRDLAIQA